MKQAGLPIYGDTPISLINTVKSFPIAQGFCGVTSTEEIFTEVRFSQRVVVAKFLKEDTCT